MHKLLGAILVLTFAMSPIAQAKESAPSQYTQTAPDEADLQSHKHYTNKDGQDVHSPAKSKSGKVPQGASAKCRDNSYSFSKHRSGTCSRHGGVAQWMQ